MIKSLKFSICIFVFGILLISCRNNHVTTSKSEAKRLIEQGGIEINGKRLTNPYAQLEIKEGMTAKRGRKLVVIKNS